MAIHQSSGEATGEAADAAAVRQALVDELAILGITEEEVADFLSAYDLLVSDDFMAAYDALSDEDKQAYEEALVGVLSDYFEAFFTGCDFGSYLFVDDDSDHRSTRRLAGLRCRIYQPAWPGYCQRICRVRPDDH